MCLANLEHLVPVHLAPSREGEPGTKPRAQPRPIHPGPPGVGPPLAPSPSSFRASVLAPMALAIQATMVAATAACGWPVAIVPVKKLRGRAAAPATKPTALKTIASGVSPIGEPSGINMFFSF